VDAQGRATELTYAELDARVNQLANYLLSLGLPPESPVGVMLPKSADALVAILGIMKAGMVYLPLDPNYPEERLRYMIEDSGLALVIKDQGFMIKEAALGIDPALIMNLQSLVQSQPTSPPAITLHPDNAAYIIYTSGSTGQPKGVVAHHRGVVNFIMGFLDTYELRPDDRLLQFASFNFDASIADIFLAQSSGGALIFGPPEVYASAEGLLRFLQEEHINYAVLPPSLLAALPEADLPDLRVLVSAGEACTWEVVRRWARGRRFFNGYGPTETSVGVSNYRARPEDESDHAVPIGMPLPNLTFHVLDAHMQPLPVGVPGELYIGGVGVTRGYLNRPDLTAERFLPDPFIELNADDAEKADLRGLEKEKSKEISENPDNLRHLRSQNRLYRTGDLVRRLPDGNLEFLGRVDHQVKVRGYRIELGEIERQLDRHPRVQKSVVVLQETGASKRLVAFFTPEGDPSPEASDLREFLARFLPDYMIPAHLAPLDALPLTPSGKVDRRALAQRPVTLPEDRHEIILPRDERETILARIWAELLGLETVGVEDNFFELGGDSILAIQMISRAAEAGLGVTAKQLFQHPTIAGLAAVAQAGEAVRAEQGVVTGAAPLTPIQRWFFQQAFPHPEHWNQAVLLDVGRPLDAGLLKQAVAALARHHDALRLRFRRDASGAWVQENLGWDVAWQGEASSPENDRRVGAAATPGAEAAGLGTTPRERGWVEVIDLSDIPDDFLAEAVTRHCARVQGGLNLTEGPLFRAAYFDLGQDRGWRLLLVAHHLVIDGVSWRILTEDLQRAYMQLASGQPVQLPRKTTAFIHWARALAGYARTADLADDLAFWREVAAAPNPRLSLRSEESPDANIEARAATETLTLDEETTRALLQDLPAALNAAMQTALLAALAWALRDWTGDARFKLALEGHGRDLALPGVDVTRTVGWFTSLYPLALDITGVGDMREALARVGEIQARVPDHGVTYGILRYLRGEASLAGQEPILGFNYLGQFQGDDQGAFQAAVEDKGPERHLQNPRPHLLDATASIFVGVLTLRIMYPSSLLASERVHALLTAWRQALMILAATLQNETQAQALASDLDMNDDEFDDLLAELDI